MFSANTTQVSSGGYQISRSLRFNSPDSAYLNRTPASTSSRTTFTFSAWIKTSTNYSGQSERDMITAWNGGGSQWDFLDLKLTGGVLAISGYNTSVQTTAVFRDPSAWYHFVWATDTTQATDTNRFKLYVNGVQQTISGTYPPQNQLLPFNTASVNNNIGYSFFGTQYFDGYMTEVNFIDGQQLTPSSFGETNAQTGVWQPKAYSGSYGTNGFYLNFSDNSNTTASTLGKDYSGNGNNWTPNNFSVTAGAGNDSLVDVPTPYGADTGAGGTVQGNYCTLNPISTAGGTFTNGNLDWASPSTDGRFCLSTISVNNMNCYCEVTIGSATSFQQVGVYGNATTFNPRVQYRSDGQASIDGVAQATYASFTTNDIIGIAYNSSTGSTSFYKNGTLQGSMTATSATVTQYFAAGSNSSGAAANYTFNFGQRPFAYTAPSGFKALCTQNLPTPTIGATSATTADKFFTPVIYTGTGSTQSITSLGFQPDWTWIKSRSYAEDHMLVDAVRGTGAYLFSDLQNAEVTGSTTRVTSFNSNGFSLGTSTSVNTNAATYVAWNWRASNATAVSNTAGSITSTVSANTTSGFSVVTYTGTGANATVGHGLGVAPSMLIIKRRNDVVNWAVYHASLGATKYMNLDLTDAAATASTPWNNTAPTSTVFSIGTASSTNVSSSATYVAYCFAPIAGYSAFGSYTGNGSVDGPFVFTGFRPAFIMRKSSTLAYSWYINDSSENPYNVIQDFLAANTSSAQTLNDVNYAVDIVSNGFKVRSSHITQNNSGDTYIYMAFASNPFKYSLAR
jgi:hypothetical protein